MNSTVYMCICIAMASLQFALLVFSCFMQDLLGIAINVAALAFIHTPGLRRGMRS